MAEVFKFDHADGSTIFHDYEVLNMNIKRTQKIDLYRTKSGYYYMNKIGQQYYVFSITFYIKYKDTLTKLETLYNQAEQLVPFNGVDTSPDSILFYYLYNRSTDYVKYVQMDRGMMQWRYNAGVTSKYQLRIDFYETKKDYGLNVGAILKAGA